MAINKTTTAQIGVVNQLPSAEKMNQYWAQIKFTDLYTNFVNENLYDNKLLIKDVSFVGDTIVFNIQWRGIGTAFNYANPDAYLENRAVATTITYNLNNKVQYAYSYNNYQQVQDQPNYVQLIANQGQFAYQWFTKYLATLTRWKIYQYCLATGQFMVYPKLLEALPQTTASIINSLGGGGGTTATGDNTTTLSYWMMLNVANRIIQIKQNFNQINYGLPDDSIVFMSSLKGYLALTTGAKGWGGSNAAFDVYQSGDQVYYFGVPVIRDIFLGNVSTEIYSPTASTTITQTMDLSHVQFMIYNKLGAFKCLKPQFAHNFTFQAFTYHEVYMFDAEVFVLPTLGYAYYVILDAEPTLPEINNARNYLATTNGYNIFFNSTNLPQFSISDATAIENFMGPRNWTVIIENGGATGPGGTQQGTWLWPNQLNTSINDYGTYAQDGTTPTTSILNQGASLDLKIQNLQGSSNTTTTDIKKK